ncbi:hypothetical protein R3P38DRAFT_3143854 [Favolaschia claudopus]|uniref:CCHC-type domain-containing protein n=1 Tax=Favolaschia claudopus TaxID=2862362 RepID=A0AAV9Z425_9AGAR
MRNIQTQEQLDEVRSRLDAIGPPTQRLTGPTEGRPRGEGANIQPRPASQSAARNRCGLCHQHGHNRRSCPQNKEGY